MGDGCVGTPLGSAVDGARDGAGVGSGGAVGAAVDDVRSNEIGQFMPSLELVASEGPT